MIDLFDIWFWMGGVEFDLFNRIGGLEMVWFVREINWIGKELGLICLK